MAKKDEKNSKKTALEHDFIPKHEKLTEEEKQKLYDRYNISLRELPKITKKDPAIKHLQAKPSDVIKIARHSDTAGKTTFYRGVIDE